MVKVQLSAIKHTGQITKYQVARKADNHLPSESMRVGGANYQILDVNILCQL